MPIDKRWTAEDRANFLEILRRTGNVSLAARSSNIARSGAYWLRDRDEWFADEWKHAVAEATDNFHEEARRRAVEGVEEPVYYQGEVVGHVTKYSDMLLHALLKAHDPRFRDKVALEHSSDPERPVSVRLGAEGDELLQVAKVLQEVGALDE